MIAYVDGSEVFKSKNTKKIVIYLSISLTAGILGLLLIMDVKIPNPMEPVQALIVSIFGKD
jgi:branched-subunit amino acid transport protein AzlD